MWPLMLRSVYQRNEQQKNGMLLTKEDGAESKVYPDFGAMISQDINVGNWQPENIAHKYIQSMAYILV